MTQDMNELENTDQAYLGADASGDDVDDSGLIVAEERKPVNRTSLVLLALLVVGVGGIWFMRQRTGGPATAAASAQAETARATISEFLTGGPQNLRAMQDLLRNTEKVVQRFAAFPSKTQVPLEDLRTNPFRFAAPKSATPPEESDEMARRRKEAERKASLAAVQKLKLQSVIYGDSRRACMISNAVYSEGQSVEGIEIEKITPNSVIVRHNGYRFEIRTNR